MDHHIPARLMALDPETRDHVLALAVEIATAPQPIDGLTPQQAHIVGLLRAARGRWAPYAALAEAVQRRDSGDPIAANAVSVQIAKMRGHPLRICIETCGGGRGRVGAARWIGGVA